MAEVRLSSNWAGYPPGRVVSVSTARAEYLINELKIAKYTNKQLELHEEELAEKKARRVAKVKAEGK
jgi:hypothetical protein